MQSYKLIFLNRLLSFKEQKITFLSKDLLYTTDPLIRGKYVFCFFYMENMQHKPHSYFTLSRFFALLRNPYTRLITSLLMCKSQKDRSYPIRCYIVLYVLGELFFVSIFIFLHQVTHIICNILAHDMLAVNLCIEFFAFWVITRETLGTVKEQLHSELRHPAKCSDSEASFHKEVTVGPDSAIDNWGIGPST